MVIDGNSLLHRAFYALPPLSNAAGQATGAVYGFLTMLFRLLEIERPDYLAVAFDRRAPTFRHRAYDGYKAHRPGMPDDLVTQLGLLKDSLRALRMPVVELDGYEADDLLGTLAARAERRDWQTVLVTGDRDALQLVSPKTVTLLTKKGITDVKRYDEAAVRQEYGLEPRQIIDLKGLMGDASDNIPGVPGVGEKTALKLVQQFGSLEEVLRDPGQAPGARLQAALREHADLAALSKRLATIDCDAPVVVDLTELRLQEPDSPVVQDLFTRLEFRSLLRRLPGSRESRAADAPPVTLRVECKVAGSPGELRTALEALPGRGEIAWVLQQAKDGSALGAGLATEPGRAVDVPAEGLRTAWEALAEVWAKSDLAKVCHDAKPTLVRLLREGRPARGLAFDAAVAAYLLDSSRSTYRLTNLCREYGLGDLPLPEEAPPGYPWAGTAAAALHQLYPLLRERLQSDGLARLFDEVELPLVEVLAVMEHWGVRVEREGLDSMARELEGRIAALVQEIHGLAGLEFNVSSTRQLGEVLFGKLGLPVLKKTKTGPSTDSEVLEALAPQHEIVDKVLEYRTLVKLKSTYVDGLRGLIDPATGRVHTTFNQTVTATGRLSSTEPNLQNIPVRLEEGRRIRKVFAAAPGMVLLTADYSQIELRVLAHIAADRNLQQAFLDGEDIHARTAGEIFDLPLGEVTRAQRAAAKAVNFGIVYGISDFGLSRNIGISRAQAKDYIESYLGRYPGVRAYMESTVAGARSAGYVRTLLGRRRYLPDINSRNRTLRQFAERMAINTPIQGSAADIIKVAMLNLHRRLVESESGARLILQVHDELILELPPESLREVADLVRREMEGAVQLTVPLVVDLKTGPNWYDLEPLEI